MTRRCAIWKAITSAHWCWNTRPSARREYGFRRPQMEAAERELVLHHLAASRERLLQGVAGLSEEQRGFRTAGDRWSVADCVEHLVVVEAFVFGSLKRSLASPAEPAKQAEVRGKE